MVSNSDEETWSIKQRQLEYNRNSRYRKLNPKTTYTNIHSNRKVQNGSKASNGFTTDRSDRVNKQKTIIIPKKNNNNNYTPLASPTQFRNNTSADPFDIKPLPQITTPYFSSRDQRIPDLESWGIRNLTYNNDPLSLDRMSPYLPTYSAIVKNPKSYVVVPSLHQTFGATNWNSANPKLDYISTIPYNKPEIESTIRNYEFESYKLKSDEYVKNAQEVLKKTSVSTYDGTELFSTKFLEDLDHKVNYEKPKLQPRKNRIKFDPIAEEIFHKTKLEAYREVPPIDYYNEPPPPAPVPRRDIRVVDFAENVYNTEINTIVRNIAEKSLNDEKNKFTNLEQPIYNTIFEPVLKKMLLDVSREVLKERDKKIKLIESNEIKKVAKEKLVNDLMLDHMLDTVAQHGKVVAENDDVAKLLDGMVLDILLSTHIDVRKVKDKTIKNYPLKKFHLNSFMNVTLDVLVAELSSSLEEDMKELDFYEKKSN